jgi:phage shock protein PspC (stress-responsive transcriptional regulator)
MNCNDAVEALIASVESGSGMSAAQREHIQSCARCRELLDSAKHFQSMLEPEPLRMPQIDPKKVESEVRHEHVKSVATKIAAGLVAITAFGLLLAWSRTALGLPLETLQLMAVFALVVVFAPVVVLYLIARSLARREGQQLYRRLHPERWWLGVCVGLGEATRVDKQWFRLGFVLFTLFGSGVGVLFYIVLALAMPVHPADREYLWRFQARRLLARLRSW